MDEFEVASPPEFLLDLKKFIEDRGGYMEVDMVTASITATHRITVDTQRKVVTTLTAALMELGERQIYGTQRLQDTIADTIKYFNSTPIDKLNLIH